MIKTLGILEADTLYADLQAEYHSYGQMLAALLRRHSPSLNFRFYQVQQGELPSPYECDAYLITGSKAGVYDDLPWLAPLGSWIQDRFAGQEKLLGICFGHQMIAHSLEGFAAKSSKGWGVGLHDVQVDCLPAVFGSDKTILNLIYSHQDQVERLPVGAQRLAGSEFCPNAAYFIGDQVLCFQGHPEFDVTYTKRLLGRRWQAIGEELLNSKLAALQPAADAELVGSWMAKWIEA